MILVEHPQGHVAVSQADHAAMCAEFAEAWGNERFGALARADEVRLAAEQHELGWAAWDDSPTLDPATGLPCGVRELSAAVHLPMQIDGPRKLAARSPYAALLVSHKHASMYRRPSVLGLLRPDQRRIRTFLDRSASLQAELRAGVDARDEEIDRDWRLVRVWDALSHDLLFARAPCIRQGVPSAGGPVELRLDLRGELYTLDPWPFATDRLSVHAAGRLLTEGFSDEARMRSALAAAPRITLTYDLSPA